MYFLGFQLDAQKNLLTSLKKIPGFNFSINKFLIRSMGFTEICFLNHCRKSQTLKLQKLIFLLRLTFGVDSLKQKIFYSRENLRLIKHRRAIRFFQKLPVRGQRTKTNAQTARRFFGRFN